MPNYIDIEISTAEILIDSGNGLTLTNLLVILKENDVRITKQLLHYHLKKMLDKGTLMYFQQKYFLPDIFFNSQYLQYLKNGINKIKKEEFNGSNNGDDTQIMNNLILLNKVLLSEIDRSQRKI